MLHIRNSGLYKAQYGTFESYLEKRWDIARQSGYRQLASAEFLQKISYIDSKDLSPIGDKNAIVLPTNESQVRPLIDCLDHDGERLHKERHITQWLN